MKESINFDDPKFVGLSKKKIKKLVKSEKHEAQKSEWKKAKREAKKKRKLEQKAAEKHLEVPPKKELVEPAPDSGEFNKVLKPNKKELKKLALEKFEAAPIIVIDASFEDSLNHNVR